MNVLFRRGLYKALHLWPKMRFTHKSPATANKGDFYSFYYDILINCGFMIVKHFLSREKLFK